MSNDDVQLIEDVCNVMDKVYMKGESLKKMDNEFKLFENETDRFGQHDQINGNLNIVFLEIWNLMSNLYFKV